MKQTIIKIMKKKQPKWKPIKMGEKLPCQSFLRKKNGEILKLSTGAGIKVGQDAYYIPVDDVIEEIKNYPIEESEDEMICRKLIAFLKQCKGVYGDSFKQFDLNIDDAIAWLEKQSEPTEINPSEFDSQLNSLLKKFESLPKEELASSLSFYLNVVRNDGTYKEEKQGEKKPTEWNDEDYVIQRAALEILMASPKTVASTILKESVIVWLQSLKDRIAPQPNQEWSEEDKKLIDDTCNLINTLASGYGTTNVTEPITFTGSQMIANIKSKLRALVDCRPQNTRKPSDEHYELEEFAKIVRCNLTGISKAVQELFKAKYLQLTGRKMYGGFKD